MAFDTAADNYCTQRPMEGIMGLIGIVIMWVIAVVALIILHNDRYGRIYKEREKQWRKYN